MESKLYQAPTEIVELPSKGLVYPPDNPLATGKVEIQYMTAYHEDILTNSNYIKQGTVLDKLLQSLIVSKIKYEDLILGDKDALLVAARVLGYGKEYSFKYSGEEITIDLSELENKQIDEKLFVKGKNEFEFVLPNTEQKITFKFLTLEDDKKIKQELEGYKKLNKNPEMLIRLKYMILSVDGNQDKKFIQDFINKGFLAKDSRAFRDYLKKIQPGVDLTFNHINSQTGLEEKLQIPIGISFFWPESEL